MTKRNGILFVINNLASGGAEHLLFDLTAGLKAEGKYRPIVACLQLAGPESEKFENQGIKVCQRLLRDKYDLTVIPRLMRVIIQHKIRIVVPVGSGGDRMFWSTLSAKLAGAKVAVWSHTYSQPGHPEFELANRALYPLVDKFIALGSRHKNCLTWRDKVPEGKITVIRNGIDVKKFANRQWRDRARAILGLADEHIIAIAIIANLRQSKRHDIFIEAAKKIVRHVRNVHFFIIGDGPNRINVNKWAKESELQGQFLSMLGHRDDLPHILPGLDIDCLCSEYQECLSLSAIQAMAAGVPVISNFIGSMDEIITNNETGFFYQPLSSDALANKILEIIDKPPLRAEVAESAFRMVRDKFDTTNMVSEFCSLFGKMTETRFVPTGTKAIMRKIWNLR